MRGAASAPLLTAWASVYFDLIWSTLRIAVRGHECIGVLRLCGFNVVRNTYKPLLAESLLEFWSRYYYYFEELLVESFYPTFARYRVRPWLRTLLAVFAAAFAGNLYYHVINQRQPLVEGDIAGLWRLLHARIFYCLLLATGIYVSMLREQGRRGGAPEARGGAARAADRRRVDVLRCHPHLGWRPGHVRPARPLLPVAPRPRGVGPRPGPGPGVPSASLRTLGCAAGRHAEGWITTEA